MKRTASLLILSAGLFSGSAAMAAGYYYYDAPGPYVGLSLGALQYNEDGLDNLTPGTALLRLGVPLSRNLSLEGRAGSGLGNSSQGGYRVSVDSIYAGYMKGSLPLAPGFSLYAVGGVATVNLRRDFGFSETQDTGLSFGIGADFNLGGGAGLNVEWTQLPSGNNYGYDYTNSMATIGMTWHF